MKKTKVSYLLTENLIVIKLEGEVRLFSSSVLEYAYDLLSKVRTNQVLCIDLSDAYHLDSTICGTIAKFCLAEPHGKQITIFYNHGNIYKQLYNLGIHHLCQISEGKPTLLTEKAWVELKEIETEKETLRTYVQSAHQILAKLCNDKSIQSVVDETSKQNKNH